MMLKNEKILNDDESRIIGFRTIYSNNRYINKIEVIEFDEITDENNCQIIVYFADGNITSFFWNISIIWSGQFGINVSSDGTKLYIPNDRKGLQCRSSFDGEIIWKTRLTSAGAICINDNNTITCITSTSIIILDENGKKVNSKKIMHYSGRKASNEIIVAQISEERVAVFESVTLEQLSSYSLDEMGFNYYTNAIIYDQELHITGRLLNPKHDQYDTVCLKLNARK